MGFSNSFEIFPLLKAAHSTLPAPTFHSSPSAAQNSDSVSPGGSLRITSLSLGAGALGADLEPEFGAAFFLVAAITGSKPPERPFVEFDILEPGCLVVEDNRDNNCFAA